VIYSQQFPNDMKMKVLWNS